MANQAIQTPGSAPGITTPRSDTAVPQQTAIPFVRAAGPIRTGNIGSETGTLATTSTPIIKDVHGTGFLLWIDLELALASAGNASTQNVALKEDAPWSSFSSLTLDDGGPQNVNVDGYSMFLLNLYGGYGGKADSSSSDTHVYSAISTGTAATAGSGTFRLSIPLAINDRDLWGLMGNQDKSTKYNLRTDLAGTGSIYATAPTNAPTYTLSKKARTLPVPSAANSRGIAQERIPPHYGIVHFMNMYKSEAAPVGGSTVDHWLHNLNNAVRLFILVFRTSAAGTERASAESNMPSTVAFKVGSDTIWYESTNDRRRIMYERYRIDAPSGVLVYDAVRDFSALGGYELGDRYLYMGDISEAEFQITYPSGFSTGGNLTIITDSLYIPPGVNIYANEGI